MTHFSIENLNYHRDPRVANAGQNQAPTIWIEEIDDQGEAYDVEVELPWKWDVCPTCDGKGSHVNPSIDCNGLTAEDFYDGSGRR